MTNAGKAATSKGDRRFHFDDFEFGLHHCIRLINERLTTMGPINLKVIYLGQAETNAASNRCSGAVKLPFHGRPVTQDMRRWQGEPRSERQHYVSY